MEKGAQWNNKKVDLSELRNPAENVEKEDQLGFSDLFKTKEMLIITVVMFFNWPIINMGYFGLGLSMTELGGNIFVDFILGALVEVRISICKMSAVMNEMYDVCLSDSRLFALCTSY